VHKYFNPYETPYDAYIVYMNVLNDLNETIIHRQHSKKKKRGIAHGQS